MKVVGLLFITGIILTIGIFMMFFRELNALKCLVLSIVTYFFEYILVCAILFCFDSFELLFSLSIILIVNIVLLIFGYIKGKRPSISFEYKKYLCPIIISTCILPFTINKFGFFGMGQDQGVYQTQSISMIYGNTNLQMDFEEFEVLNDEEKVLFRSNINRILAGLYGYDVSFRNTEKRMSQVSSEYHGIPTFVAMLALWGTIFGMENMSGVNTIFLICIIFLVYFISENLAIKKSSRVLATLMTAFSPIILWVSKSSLTETFLTVIICYLIYCLTYKENNKYIHLSVLPITVFSFYHITIYTVIPVFVLIYFVLYFFKGNKAYINSLIAILAGFFAGMVFMTNVSAGYAYGNFSRLYLMLPFINSNNVLIVFLVVSVFGIIVALVAKSSIALSTVQRIKKQAIYVWLIRIVLASCFLYQVRILYSLSKESGSIIDALHHMTFVGFAMATGIIILPVLCCKLIRKPTVMLANQNTLVVGLLFIYCILIYSSVLRQEIPYYYYYGRYLGPFIPIIALMGATYFDSISDKLNYAVAVICFLILLPFNQLHIEGLDDTTFAWGVLEDFELFLTEEDAVLIEEEDLMRFLYLPLKSITGCKVFIVFDQADLNDQIDRLDEIYENIYYIGSNKNIISENMEIIYRNRYEVSEDIGEYTSNILPFPLDHTTTIEQIVCYIKRPFSGIIDVINDEHEIKGLNPYNADIGFKWTYNERVYIPCILAQTDYELIINQGNPFPLVELSLKEYVISVFVNDKYIGQMVINEDNNGEEISIKIPVSFIQKGKNYIVLESDLWSPSDYGANDTRQLGFAISSIEFIVSDVEIQNE